MYTTAFAVFVEKFFVRIVLLKNTKNELEITENIKNKI